MITDERLAELAQEAGEIAKICETHGELDGRTAAQAQARAMQKELDMRAQEKRD